MTTVPAMTSAAAVPLSRSTTASSSRTWRGSSSRSRSWTSCFPNTWRAFATKDTSPHSGKSSLSTRRETDTQVTRTNVELELSDNKTSQASIEVFGKSDELRQQCDPGPADLEAGAGMLQPFHDSSRPSSSTQSPRYHLECSIAEDKWQVTQLYIGEIMQVPSAMPSTTETSTGARGVVRSTASSGRIPGDRAAVQDDDSCAISEDSREVYGSADTRVIKSPVSLPVTATSASMSPRSEQEEQSSEEPMDSVRYAVHKREIHPVNILKEAKRRTVPRDLNFLILENSILLGWEKPDLPNCPVVGFEIYVNSKLQQRIRSNLQDRAFISGVDLSKKVTIAMHAITPQGRLQNPARLTLLPSQ